MGRGDKEKAEEIENTAFRLLLLSGTILFVIGECFGGPILLLFGATKAELVYALPYLRIYLLGTLCIMISTGMNPFINGQGFPMVGMATVAVGAISNMILDPIFIFGLRMGVNGAAIATVISQALSATLVLSFLFGKRNEYRIRRGRLSGKWFPHAREIAALGLSPFVMQFTNSLVNIVCNSMLMRFGGAVFVSVMTIISSVRQILDTPVLAITEGSSPVISYNYGARRPERVKKAMKIMTSFAIGYTFFMWIFIELKPELLIGIFTSDAELAALVKEPLHLYFFAFIFQSFQYSGQTMFKALGKKNHAIFFSLFRKVVMVVPLTLILPRLFLLGTDGVFMAEPISNLIGGLCCFTTMLLTVLPELKNMNRD